MKNTKRFLMEQFYTCLKNNLIDLELDFYSEEDFYEYLEVRDEKIFDRKWLEIHAEISLLENKIENKDLIESICEEVYMKVMRFSGVEDLAACISDDFELIFKALDVDYNNRWLNGMMVMYLDDRFPNDADEIEEEGTEESIKSQLEKYLRIKS